MVSTDFRLQVFTKQKPQLHAWQQKGSLGEVSHSYEIMLCSTITHSKNPDFVSPHFINIFLVPAEGQHKQCFTFLYFVNFYLENNLNLA
jgi:hypothetical protein